MAKKMRIESCRYIPVTELVPKQWQSWFYEVVSNNAPFGWGDNNRTMITPSRFAKHCANRLEYVEEVHPIALRSWLKKIQSIPSDVYIDLEN